MNRRTGFTLVEVLLVIAVMALCAGLLVSGAADLLRTKEPRADEIFWQAVTAARQLALERDRTVVFRYDKDKHQLVWSADPEDPHRLAFPGRLLELLPVAGQGTVLIGGQLTETGSVSLVRFFPDGGCDPFRAQLTDSKDRRTVLAIDPWTCAPMIAATSP